MYIERRMTIENRKIRSMRIEILSKARESQDYLLGRITGIVDANINEKERVFIIGSTKLMNIKLLKFWATTTQYEKIRNDLERLVPMKLVNIQCYNVD